MMVVDDRGQAAVELVAMLPIVATVALACGQLLAAGAAREAAASAAQAAAMAHLQGGDPARAARSAAPGWARARMSIRLEGPVARVTVTPRAVIPGAEKLLVAHARADRGPGR